MTQDEALYGAQADVADIIGDVESLASDLECAESCETMQDFKANLDSAATWAQSILRDLQEMRREVEGE